MRLSPEGKIEWKKARLRFRCAAANNAICPCAKPVETAQSKRTDGVRSTQAKIAVAAPRNRITVIATSPDCEWAIQCRANVTQVPGKAEAVVVSALDADDAVDGIESVFDLSHEFVSNPLRMTIPLVIGVDGYEVRLQQSKKLVRSFLSLGESHC